VWKWGTLYRLRSRRLSLLWVLTLTYGLIFNLKGKTMSEEIRDIAGYEGRYAISNTGRVISYPNGSRKGVRELKQERLKAHEPVIYRRVTLSVNGQTTRFFVHRLVAAAFIPNPENKPFINHINNNGEFNYATNLEWCTAKENMAHSSKQGRQDKGRSLGGKATQKKRQPKIMQKLKNLLGDRLISTVIKPRSTTSSRWVTYRCKYCGNVFHKRADTPAIQRGGVCTDCYRDEDMVWTA